MITEATIPLETTRNAFGNQEKSKQRSAIVLVSEKEQTRVDISKRIDRTRYKNGLKHKKS